MPWNSNKSVCSLSYPACKARASYCHLRPVPFNNIFPKLRHKRNDFWKNVVENKMCVLIFSTNFPPKSFSFQEEFGEILSQMCKGLHVKYPILLPDFHEHLNILDRLTTNMQTLNFMKIRSVGAEVFLADRKTQRHEETNSRFIATLRNAPKITDVRTTNLRHCFHMYVGDLRLIYHAGPVHVKHYKTNFFIIKPARSANFTNLFWT